MDYNELEFKTVFNHCSFKSLLKFSDGQLCTEDGCSFKIHKIHLARHSKYFYQLFCGDADDDKKEFLVPGVTGIVLGNILSYIYMDSAYITEENICDILMAADYFQLNDLIEYIKNVHLKGIVSVNNCLPLYITEQKIDPKHNVCSSSYRCIQLNFEAIVQTDDGEIGKLPFKNFKKLLADRNLRVTNESVIWMAIDKWVQSNPTHRRDLLPQLLMHLSVSEIGENIATMIVEHKYVKLNPVCEQINRLKNSNESESNLEILQKYILQRLKPGIISFHRRIPEYIHFIYTRTNLYVTYDENIDLWRKIGTRLKEWHMNMLLIGRNLYFFGFSITCYNLIIEDYVKMPQFAEHTTIDYAYHFLQLKGLIYILVHDGFKQNHKFIGEVQVYNPGEGLWHKISPLPIKLDSFKAVVLKERIHVVGFQDGNKCKSPAFTQVYYDEQDTWVVLKGPSISRERFVVATYRGRLFIMGGKNEETDITLTNVEVFDPVRKEWANHKDLPEIFSRCYFFETIVLNDKLIIYGDWDDDDIQVAFYWNENLGNWIDLKDPPLLKAVYKHYIYTHHNCGMMNTIVETNRELETKFKKSPFNED